MEKVNLEILVSTMNRTDLSFLEPMFPGRKLVGFHLLIINQTTKDKILKSEFPNIRVINSFERGLSKSRNLALKNSIGEVALLADDDMVYLPEFDRLIASAFDRHPAAALIGFQLLGKGGAPFKKYLDREREIGSLKNEPSLSSCEIAFKPAIFKQHEIFFNEYFGLGANFPSGEETLLMQEILTKKLLIFHCPVAIGTHAHASTGNLPENSNHIRGIAALKQLKYGRWAWLSLLRYVCLGVKNKKIRWFKSVWAYRMGLKAIRECKQIFENQQSPFR